MYQKLITLFLLGTLFIPNSLTAMDNTEDEHAPLIQRSPRSGDQQVGSPEQQRGPNWKKNRKKKEEKKRRAQGDSAAPTAPAPRAQGDSIAPAPRAEIAVAIPGAERERGRSARRARTRRVLDTALITYPNENQWEGSFSFARAYVRSLGGLSVTLSALREPFKLLEPWAQEAMKKINSVTWGITAAMTSRCIKLAFRPSRTAYVVTSYTWGLASAYVALNTEDAFLKTSASILAGSELLTAVTVNCFQP